MRSSSEGAAAAFAEPPSRTWADRPLYVAAASVASHAQREYSKVGRPPICAVGGVVESRQSRQSVGWMSQDGRPGASPPHPRARVAPSLHITAHHHVADDGGGGAKGGQPAGQVVESGGRDVHGAWERGRQPGRGQGQERGAGGSGRGCGGQAGQAGRARGGRRGGGQEGKLAAARQSCPRRHRAPRRPRRSLLAVRRAAGARWQALHPHIQAAASCACRSIQTTHRQRWRSRRMPPFLCRQSQKAPPPA